MISSMGDDKLGYNV